MPHTVSITTSFHHLTTVTRFYTPPGPLLRLARRVGDTAVLLPTPRAVGHVVVTLSLSLSPLQHARTHTHPVRSTPTVTSRHVTSRPQDLDPHRQSDQCTPPPPPPRCSLQPHIRPLPCTLGPRAPAQTDACRLQRTDRLAGPISILLRPAPTQITFRSERSRNSCRALNRHDILGSFEKGLSALARPLTGSRPPEGTHESRACGPATFVRR